MKHLPKDVYKLKDKELAEHLFPKEVLEKVKAELKKDSKIKPIKKK
jgi:hypothetical protein